MNKEIAYYFLYYQAVWNKFLSDEISNIYSLFQTAYQKTIWNLFKLLQEVQIVIEEQAQVIDVVA